MRLLIGSWLRELVYWVSCFGKSVHVVSWMVGRVITRNHWLLKNTRKWTTTSRGAWKRQKKTGYENSVVRLKKNWGRTTVRGHRNSWNIWPLWNREQLHLSKIVQENASQKNERYWTDGQYSPLSCTITRPMEIHLYWTVPRQTHRMTTLSFAKKWRLQYNHWSKGSQLVSTTSKQNWSKQVERM